MVEILNLGKFYTRHTRNSTTSFTDEVVSQLIEPFSLGNRLHSSRLQVVELNIARYKGMGDDGIIMMTQKFPNLNARILFQQVVLI